MCPPLPRLRTDKTARVFCGGPSCKFGVSGQTRSPVSRAMAESVQNASSNRSTCRTCGQKVRAISVSPSPLQLRVLTGAPVQIDKGVLRVGIEMPGDQYTYTAWHHATCKRVNDANALAGFSTLSAADQATMLSLAGRPSQVFNCTPAKRNERCGTHQPQ
jgi:hypothetical protein